MKSIIDKYLEYSICGDLIIFAVLKGISVICCKWFGWCITIPKDTTLQALLNELVSSSIGVGGFIITVLTIIIAFRESVINKPKENIPKNGFLWILSNSYYKQIIKVFSKAFLVSVFTFAYFSYLEIFWITISSENLALDLVTFGLLITCTAILRCFLILKMLIDIQIDQME
jgi:hypothetical protein